MDNNKITCCECGVELTDENFKQDSLADLKESCEGLVCNEDYSVECDACFKQCMAVAAAGVEFEISMGYLNEEDFV